MPRTGESASLVVGIGTSDLSGLQAATSYSGVLTLVVLPTLLSAWLIAYGFFAGATRLDVYARLTGRRWCRLWPGTLLLVRL